jgi:hypothetical protein
VHHIVHMFRVQGKTINRLPRATQVCYADYTVVERKRLLLPDAELSRPALVLAQRVVERAGARQRQRRTVRLHQAEVHLLYLLSSSGCFGPSGAAHRAFADLPCLPCYVTIPWHKKSLMATGEPEASWPWRSAGAKVLAV